MQIKLGRKDGRTDGTEGEQHDVRDAHVQHAYDVPCPFFQPVRFMREFDFCFVTQTGKPEQAARFYF